MDLAGIPLDVGLLWVDEFRWAPVAQKITPMLGGGQLVQETVKTAGRPVTLQGSEERGWIRRAEVLALHAKLTAVAPMTLTLADGRVLQVAWRHVDVPLEADLLRDVAVPDDDEYYRVTLRLMTV